MKHKRKIIVLLFLLVLLSGCKKNEDKEAEILVENHFEETVELSKTESSIPVEITIINVSGVDIGMLSIIDPSSKEQLNIAELDDGSSMAISVNWPEEENELKWALYNKNGELCVEGTSDLTGMKKSATIVLGGDGDVTDIDVNVN